MMQRAALAGAAALVCLPVMLVAQQPAVDPQCHAGTINGIVTQDACQKAIDIFQFMAPQLGVIIAGGNAVSGEHSTLRGLGHFSLGIRANVIESRLPRIDRRTPSITGAVADEYPTRKQVLGAPTVDAAIGLFRGVPVSGTHALGLDALVNVTYIPSVDDDDVAISTVDGSVKLGLGARLGVVRETFLTPGVVITYLRRDLPVVDVLGRVGSDEINVRDVNVKTSAWRVVAGKSLSVLAVSVGGGIDDYETSAAGEVVVTRAGQSAASTEIATAQELRRTNLFASAAIHLATFKLVGEIGRVSGGRVRTYNTFADSKADDARVYASLGMRVNW